MNSYPNPNQMWLAEPRRDAKATRVTDTALTDVYVPGTQEVSILETVTVANGSGGTVPVAVFWFNGTEDFAIRRVGLDANTSFEVIDMPLPLRFGQKLKVQAGAGVDVIVVVKSVPGNLA